MFFVTVFKRMRDAGIGINVHYVPVHLHPYYQGLGYKKGICPVAEAAHEEILTLPRWVGMGETTVQSVNLQLTMCCEEKR